MDLLRLLRKGEHITYVVVLFLTALLLVLSLYLALSRLAELYAAVSAHRDVLAQAIYNALSDIFLVIVFIELIDTFITYIEQKRIVVYKIIDVALVALARELFIYLAPVNKEFQFDKAIAIVAATFVVGLVDYLQRRALRTEARRR
ncbi:putative membrane protein [Pyrobaculum sp. WP30]|nr:putative membrane protein [Pyrobaculum sp. WP30]